MAGVTLPSLGSGVPDALSTVASFASGGRKGRATAVGHNGLLGGALLVSSAVLGIICLRVGMISAARISGCAARYGSLHPLKALLQGSTCGRAAAIRRPPPLYRHIQARRAESVGRSWQQLQELPGRSSAWVARMPNASGSGHMSPS